MSRPCDQLDVCQRCPETYECEADEVCEMVWGQPQCNCPKFRIRGESGLCDQQCRHIDEVEEKGKNLLKRIRIEQNLRLISGFNFRVTATL